MVLQKPGVSDFLKETRNKDSSLATALKRWFWQSRLLPILSKRPEIRIPAWQQLSKRRFSARCSPKCYFVLKYAKPCASDSFKETRDKDSSLAAALKRPSKRPEIRIPAWRQLSKWLFSTRCLPKCYFVLKYAKPCASDSLKETRDKDSSMAAALKTVVLRKPGVSESLKETRDKDSSLAAALKRWFWQSRLLPILSKRPEIRIPAWRQLSKRRFSTRCSPKMLFCA